MKRIIFIGWVLSLISLPINSQVIQSSTEYSPAKLTEIRGQKNSEKIENSLDIPLLRPTSLTDFFITTWETTTDNEQITIPTEGIGYDYVVDWGDGISEIGLNGSATHEYDTAGIYTVMISGDFPRIYFNNEGDRMKIKSIEQWGTNTWTSMASAFAGCEDLVSNALDIPNLSLVTDMSGMFAYARKFNGDSNFSNWDVSNVTNMYGMFAGGSKFNHDINNWDVSNVTTMEEMFHGATVFKKELSNWNVGNVTNMKNMFATALRFNSAIGNWDVGNVTNMYGMFAHSVHFNQNLETWDVSNVTDMHGMFAYAREFDTDIKNWNVSNVTDMASMFAGASVFNHNIGFWNVGNVVTMKNMFFGATVFNQDLSTWDVSNVTNMEAMFRTALHFNQNISNWDVSNVTNMKYTFAFSIRFDQDLELWNIGNVEEMTGMFEGVKLSTINYDAMLTGWSNMPLKNDVNFSGGESTYCLSVTDRQFIIDSFQWTINDGGNDCALAVNEQNQIEGASEIILYPNPVQNQLLISNPNNVEIEALFVYDNTGRLVKKILGDGILPEMGVDLSTLSPSTYLVMIETEKSTISTMLIKQ